MSFDSRIAHFVTHRRRLIFIGLAVLVVLCFALLKCCLHLDSEVLNLLPGSFDSVKALKTYNRDFSQTRELTFAIYDEDHSTALEEFTEHFSTMLKKEPWVLRVMDRSPMESQDGADEVRTLALPLLFNLQPAKFNAAMALLDPQKMQERLHRLRTQIESGSPRAEIELNFDPLGLITQALKPLAGSFSVEQTQPLIASDGTLHLVLVITDQKELGPRDCQGMMKKVRDFENRALATWEGGKTPRILVTGRTPYVAEMSKGMEVDVISTLLSSVLLVAGVFYIGFRRFRPLLAIMHVLLLCCIVAVAAGGVIFHALNGITIGFCSILVGLGVDFGMLLYGSYQTERHAGKGHEAAVAGAIRQLGKGIFFGALTTGAGFLALALSDCSGFSQLGVLIAIGILLAGFFMMTVFFVFMGPKHSPRKHDWLFDVMKKYVAWVFRTPRRIMLGTAIPLLALNIFAFAPVGKLVFQADPKSLEPKDSKAGFALRTISSKMTAGGIEPVLVIVDAKDADEFHDYWTKLQTHWQEARARGEIRNISTPAPFAISPALVKENAASLAQINIAGAREILAKTIRQEGFNADSFKGSFAFIDAIAAIAKGDFHDLDWRRTLSENSSWWFVLDKFFGTEPNVGAAYITPNKTIASESAKERLRMVLETPGVPIQNLHISGWSYTLANLIPWSKVKLVELSVVMIAFNIVLLIFLYRKVLPLLILMLSLFLSIGAMVATLKLFAIPLNLFNVLAFPLVLGVGVDYGIYILLAVRQPGNRELAFATILKPVFLSGLTAVCGFGSLAFARNPSLRGLGIVCALGVAWCLFATIFFIVPAYIWKSDQ
jgi:predicted RND superfamily exporter protein